MKKRINPMSVMAMACMPLTAYGVGTVVNFHIANNSAADLPADGVVTGVGKIHGRTVCVMANDSTVKAGSWGARTVEKIVRIQTPLALLEMGMQSNNYIVSFLLWAIALDALLVAHDHDTFKQRLCSFLGDDSFVFPVDSFGAQPKYTVGEIAE